MHETAHVLTDGRCDESVFSPLYLITRVMELLVINATLTHFKCSDHMHKMICKWHTTHTTHECNTLLQSNLDINTLGHACLQDIRFFC